MSGWPGGLPTWALVSVWPYPSRMVMPHARWTCSMTSGLSGSPAERHSRTDVRAPARSVWIIIRQTVGGAQNVVTPVRSITASSSAGSKRA